jgi:hypothetical protein
VDKIKESVTKLCGPNAGFCTALQGQIIFLRSSLELFLSEIGPCLLYIHVRYMGGISSVVFRGVNI